ncbi:DUF397 domain-containing protein [Streptomyces triculaminicus]|uniref:DUF397 domain-containing protein n=2 Tax=Streptomyces TaxID=1883 RepID=A0A939JTJ2_9ACTN|nr:MULTISPECIES: DUF397 domain-containing protein [Streptomyces]MBO0656520.1 DUF397 domain-containing protein [Streptomyces triculaminicus]QSY48010.1 DUF397 domain-containing protein [Streptomyces griseocarneus]
MSNTRDFPNATWVKSSYSAGNGGQCVEFAPDLTAVVPVRDSKDTTRPPLIFQASAWSAFITSVKRTALT